MSARRDIWDRAVVAMLQDYTGKNVGQGKVPDDLTLPYAVLFALGAVNYSGSMANPQEDREALYQVTCVGQDNQQVGWMSSRIQSGFGDPSRLVIPGENVQFIFTDLLGEITETGPNLYQCVDRYRIKLGA